MFITPAKGQRKQLKFSEVTKLRGLHVLNHLVYDSR